MINDKCMTRRKTTGFTLIEILIVIVIISIISGVAIVTLSHNKTRQLETFANQLTRVITLAQQEAMLQPRTLGLAFDPHQFKFFKYKPSIKDESPWEAVNTKNLGPYRIPEHIVLRLSINNINTSLTGKPIIFFSESGDITPFTLNIASAGERPSYVIKGDASGNVRTEVYHEK